MSVRFCCGLDRSLLPPLFFLMDQRLEPLPLPLPDTNLLTAGAPNQHRTLAGSEPTAGGGPPPSFRKKGGNFHAAETERGVFHAQTPRPPLSTTPIPTHIIPEPKQDPDRPATRTYLDVHAQNGPIRYLNPTCRAPLLLLPAAAAGLRAEGSGVPDGENPVPQKQ